MDLLPEHEPFRQAIRWISLRREERPKEDLRSLVREASRRFDLSPKEEISVLHFLVPEADEE